MSKSVSITKKFYTMESDSKQAEVTMYGDIVETIPTDWFGEPIEGNYIVQDEFLADLERIEKADEITIRMNSCGGDCGVSILIHNRLRELSAKGKKLTCIVDGAAMSGGSLIMSACDTVKVNASSLIMIHKCWSFLFGGYNADELRQMATGNDAYDKAQVSIYARKTGLSDTVLLHMMSDTTYMTGKEAVEKGFADEILDEAPVEIAASADGRSIFVKGREVHLAPGMFAPDNIPTVKTSEEDLTNKSSEADITVSTKGGISMTIDELRAQYPEQIAQVEAEAKAVGKAEAIDEAVKAERDRMKGIDELSSLFDAEMVAEAKYGETACSAQELTFRAAQNAAKQGTAFLASLSKDAKEAKVNDVTPALASDDKEAMQASEDKKESARALVKQVIGNKKEG